MLKLLRGSTQNFTLRNSSCTYAPFHRSIHEKANKTIYITTPIFYVNSSPHIGHLYSALTADALARWNRLNGRETFFLTGTDEHGLKIQQAAEKKGVSPLKFCDSVSHEFKSLFDKAMISYDDFIRTTEERHRLTVTAVWKSLEDKGLIYPGTYEGWYSVPDETFLSEEEVTTKVLENGEEVKVSKISGHKVEWTSERNYKFKLQSFEKQILTWLQSGPVVPPSRVNDISQWIEKGLPDLSVSRESKRVSWALPVPGDESQSIYVWVDALTNYLTAVGYPSDPSHAKKWPSDYQIIGKDILTFHGVYWPALLMGLGLPLPKRLLTHGHWTKNHVKMSKSLGNVDDPQVMIDRYGLDPLRYFLLGEGGLGTDLDFSEEKLKERLKGVLADNFGNLLGRCTSLRLNPSQKTVDIHELTAEDSQFIEELNSLGAAVGECYESGDIAKGIEKIFGVITNGNKYFQTNEPWKLVPKKSQEIPHRVETVVGIVMEAVRISSVLLLPIMPLTMNEVLTHLGVTPTERTFDFCQVGKIPSGRSISPFKAFQILD